MCDFLGWWPLRLYNVRRPRTRALATEQTMSESPRDDEQQPQVPEYKVSEKKTISEYAALDAEDESLRKWKESLGITQDVATGKTLGDPNDPRKVVVFEMRVNVEGMEPMVFDLENKEVLEKLKKEPIAIKEKSKYNLTVKFRIQHEIVTGLRYIQVARRAGIRANKVEEACGSYPPSTEDKPFYTKEFAEYEAPSGMLARGHYTATSSFIDDDQVTHLEVPWCFDIVKG